MQKKRVKNTLIFIIVTFLIMQLSCYPFNLDETVDDSIRKNYNADKLINDAENTALTKSTAQETAELLPELPAITKSNSAKKPSDVKGNTIISAKTKSINTLNKKVNGNITFWATNDNKISDWMQKGTKVQFRTTKAKKCKNITIPSSTVFYAMVTDSHQPQISCNGGLVVLELTEMKYNGYTIPVKGYILRANDKKIFFNNIKGKRTYLSTMYKKGNWGRTLFGRMLNLTVGLGKDGSTILLSPFPFLYGTICLGANTLVSPITAFFSKGGHVSIPTGSNFKIKITEDFLIN